MKVKPLNKRAESYLKSVPHLEKAYNKQVENLEKYGTTYPSLNFETITATKHLIDPYRHYSFRLKKGYRAFCIKLNSETIEVFDINKHDY